ncbi:MAG: glutathione S-transferase domain-containing protein [Caldilineaceae bacterium]
MRLITASLARLGAALQEAEWLVDGQFTLAEAALLPAIFRLCLDMDFLWTARYPGVRALAGPGTNRHRFNAVLGYVPQSVLEQQHAAGTACALSEGLAHAA